jgi:hypothetical protein
MLTSYVQLETVVPLESVSRIVSLPAAELPLNVNDVEKVVAKPPAAIVQFVENVQVAEFTSVVHPEPPSAGALPLSPERVSLPLIVSIWSWMGGQFIPPASAVKCSVYVPEGIVQGPPLPPELPVPPFDVDPPQATIARPSVHPMTGRVKKTIFDPFE